MEDLIRWRIGELTRSVVWPSQVLADDCRAGYGNARRAVPVDVGQDVSSTPITSAAGYLCRAI